MIRFYCDYAEGAHPAILEKLAQTNLEQTEGYGEDHFCQEARAHIQTLCEAPQADVHFLVGGTQANLTVIAATLRPHEGVIATDTAHISSHETGSIEATGHKVLTVPNEDGKLTAAQVEAYWAAHQADETKEHTVKPGMVYISNPTELGTLYTLEELEALSAVCRSHGLPLYLDGARLGYGLAAEDNTLTLPDLARLCDVFYIGGTKQGALFGEAVVILQPRLKEDFRYLIKQRGGMLAKGRLLGIQFLTLFEDGLYLRLARHADELADLLREGLEKAGCPLLVHSRTNLIFPVLPDKAIEKLKEKYSFSHYQRVDENHCAVRFCTSWATKREHVEALVADLQREVKE
ncbi:low specificity L-threonine aldolase [Pseudoflavonifractor sp. AF19-9AC]|uniref:threonine aldolase family protein n=1 Tax=Pseudoflavonifractor sp. AF19-9AC TaxID=2292244 RepID=UPI000E551FA0|nr:low specificity L-threonine aldolase [Pseudoflavonifractor sp. AF19-9AC]RHR10330.1 low specificity L-threonine aldolase [Pseudoflavonifractor sp. AF19-9AC]